MIHIEHLTSVVRVYRPGDSYEFGDEPVAVATLCRTDAHTVEIMAAMGKLTRAAMREIARALAAGGVRTLVIKRAGARRMPYGKLVKTHGPFSYYEVAVEAM
ncbi:hypothetical protein ACNQFN_11450 [Thauera butanivorans]|uniref:hypothetical protein n=1 Tax=Thauera butanivorans TaxID=86174 RepID=UPI003AB746A5